MTAKEMYDMDHYTMHDIGLGSMLMENAGRAISDKLTAKITLESRIVVLAGGGHNGGDGFVVARTLHNLDYDVTVLQVVPDEKLSYTTAGQKEIFQRCDGEVACIEGDSIKKELSRATVIVDGMTGLGIKGRLRSPLAEVVEEVNHSKAFVCAIDIPSGLPADEGAGDFTAVRADMTVIVGAVKESAFLQRTAPYYGAWVLVHIGHPAKAFPQKEQRFVMDEGVFKRTMPHRISDAHKGSHGKGLLIGGSDLMPGSAVLAGKAALKTGAGLLTVASTERVIHHVASHCPEATYMALPHDHGEIVPNHDLKLAGFDAVAIGVGLGRREQTGAFLQMVLEKARCPLIIDADGIYHLKTCLKAAKQRTEPTIITPHPGEMARLMDIDVKTLLAQPFYYARQLAEIYDIYVVLKGKVTIITTPYGEQAVDLTGNPGLAKGGTGDVLTGITLAMVMQDQSIFQALCNACFVHGMSADIQVEQRHSMYDLMASDVITGIPAVYRTFRS
ncbi:NAD(P)H-hydrate dehydratase [Lentibacillus sp. JNUCC-1]|uniref:NAD(P)H-hydrate dehydratase n=1 Tax=Lentibacillus sp. JNUCC-1 TaxID=2654513 RepID=UPI002F91BB0E